MTVLSGRATSTAVRHRKARDRRSRGLELVKDLVLGAAAALGVLAIGWMCYAQVTGSTVVYFRTGSMAPTLPQGAAAIATPVAAEDLAVGDVVTVRRNDAALPVTHRIVDIAPVTGQPSARELWLQGDDNAEPDGAPYVVTEVPRVSWGSAWFGWLVLQVSQPWALGLIIGGVGLLVTWAFWPAPLEEFEDFDEGGAPA